MARGLAAPVWTAQDEEEEMAMNMRKNWKRLALLAGLSAGMMFSFSAHAGASRFAQVSVKQVRAFGRADSQNLRLLKIDGNGEVTVSPDSLRVRVSVTTQAATLEVARTEAAQKTQNVMTALQNLGIQALKVRTVAIDVEPIKEKEREGSTTPPAIIGYQVTSTLSVALTNVSVQALRDEGTRILNTSLGAGANVIGGVSFFLNNPSEARRLALAVAVEDAKRNALTMAKQAGIALVGFDSLAGERSYYRDYAQAQAKLSDGMAGGAEAPAVEGFPVEPGEIVVNAQVQANFRFVQ